MAVKIPLPASLPAWGGGSFIIQQSFIESLEYAWQCVKCWGQRGEWDLGERQAVVGKLPGKLMKGPVISGENEAQSCA